jgi:hypothetical protein
MQLRSSALFVALMSVPLAASATLVPTAPPAAHAPSALTAARACPSTQLRAAVTSDEAAMVHREVRVTLTNDGASSCVMDGFPAIRLLDAQHHVHIAEESFSGTPSAFTLAPGKSAAFGLRIATADAVTTYPMLPTLAVIPPGDVGSLMVHHALPAAPTIDVQAVVPGP